MINETIIVTSIVSIVKSFFQLHTIYYDLYLTLFLKVVTGIFYLFDNLKTFTV